MADPLPEKPIEEKDVLESDLPAVKDEVLDENEKLTQVEEINKNLGKGTEELKSANEENFAKKRLDVCSQCGGLRDDDLNSSNAPVSLKPSLVSKKKSKTKSIASIRSKLSRKPSFTPSCENSPKISKQSLNSSKRTNRQLALKHSREASLKKRSTQYCRPEKPQTPGRTLLTLKKNRVDMDELQCPENPCESLEVESVEKTQKPRQKPQTNEDKINKLKARNALETDKKQKSKTNAKGKLSTGKKLSKVDEIFSTKYLKMKYEIEMQNYVIDKMNRQLQAKTKKRRPELELCLLKQKLDLEFQKLGKMIAFAMCMQKNNPEEKWGPIPISTVRQCAAIRPRSCLSSSAKIKPPMTPSGVSVVSGFDELEDILLREDEENCEQQKSLKLKEEKMQVFSDKITEMACKLRQLHEERVRLEAEGCNKDIKCESLFEMNSDSGESSENEDSEIREHLQSVADAMKELLCNVQVMKCNIKQLHSEFNSLKHDEKC